MKIFYFTLMLTAFAYLTTSGQEYFNLAGGGAFPAGWVGTNNVTSNLIDRGSYYLLDAGNPGDLMTTASYDVSGCGGDVELVFDIRSFGSGTHNSVVVDVSLDGGSTYTQQFTSAVTTTSYTTSGPHVISPTSNDVVLRFSNSGTSGRGIRFQDIIMSCNAPACTAGLTAGTATCDANTAGTDTYSATFSFVNGSETEALTVSASEGTPDVTMISADGTITVTGATEGTDVVLTLTNTNCSLMATVVSPSCDPPLCDISNLTASNPSACNDNGTPGDPSDDYYTLDVEVTYTNPPATGDLTLSGDLVDPVSVSAAIGTSPQTFTTVKVQADGNATSITATFDDDVSCNFTNSSADPGVSPCTTPSQIGFDPAAATTGVDGTPYTVTICNQDDNGDDATTSFVSPTLTLDGSSTATATITGPTGSGPCYDFSVTPDSEGDLDLTGAGSGFTDIMVTTTISAAPDCIRLEGIMVNACNGGGNEPDNEFFVLANGSTATAVDDLDIDLPSGVDILPTSDDFAASQTGIDPTGGCISVLDDGDMIPADAVVVVFGSRNLTIEYDFVDLCASQGTVYVLYIDRIPAANQAMFGNSASTGRTTTIDMPGTDCDADYTYTIGSTSDGDYFAFDPPVAGSSSSTTPSNGCTVPAILPIELISFQAQKHNSFVRLKWSTATEINNEKFVIEHSADGRSFEALAEVGGAGTTSENQSYEYMVERPYNGMNYFRLKQVDFDGQFDYSVIRSVNMKKASTNGFVVSPNPVNQILSLTRGDNTSSATMSVYNAQGQTIILREKIDSGHTIDVSTWIPGTYFFRMEGEDGLIENKRIVVMH